MYVPQDLYATIFSQIYQLVKEPPINYRGGEGGGGCSFLFIQIICFASYLQNFIFITLGLKQNIYFTLKKLLSTKFYLKLALVLICDNDIHLNLDFAN